LQADRLSECLETIRWTPEILAEAVDVPSNVPLEWLSGREQIPRKVAAWLEALCFVHESAEESKPATSGEGYDQTHRHEFVPVYAYSLLRSLHRGPVRLHDLFGTDDEGAVYFLVSRGLALRDKEYLSITEAGAAIGSMAV
jgi:hypothetical protein